MKRSSWDFPTPSSYKDLDWSERGTKRKGDTSERSHKKFDKRDVKLEKETPRATPAYKFNTWVKNRRKTGATPGIGTEHGKLKWNSEEDKHMWEEEQRRIDREWYNIDEGREGQLELYLKRIYFLLPTKN